VARGGLRCPERHLERRRVLPRLHEPADGVLRGLQRAGARLGELHPAHLLPTAPLALRTDDEHLPHDHLECRRLARAPLPGRPRAPQPHVVAHAALNALARGGAPGEGRDAIL